MKEKQKYHNKMENYCFVHKGTYGFPITPTLATPHMITQNFPQAVMITQNFPQVDIITQHFLQVDIITQNFLQLVENVV